MTFDDVIEDILNNEDYGAFGMNVDTVVGKLEKLRQEYAPTVEMTKQQYDVLGELDIDIIKQVLLHPETIKVVGE